jgi:hypothetical protein
MLLQLTPSIAPGQRRTGPVSRLARLGLCVVFAASLYSIVDGQGSARFRNPHILTEPSAWFLHVTMLMVFVVLVGTIASTVAGTRVVVRVQIAAVTALLGCCVVAAIVGQLVGGSLWGFPLADLVWWFDVVMLVVGFASGALAMVLGTPGCEVGVVRELAACLRRGPAPSADASLCILGLHALDEWERRRTAPRSSATHSGAQ